jgi:hypothetical protein
LSRACVSGTPRDSPCVTGPPWRLSESLRNVAASMWCMYMCAICRLYHMTCMCVCVSNQMIDAHPLAFVIGTTTVHDIQSLLMFLYISECVLLGKKYIYIYIHTCGMWNAEQVPLVTLHERACASYHRMLKIAQTVSRRLATTKKMTHNTWVSDIETLWTVLRLLPGHVTSFCDVLRQYLTDAQYNAACVYAMSRESPTAEHIGVYASLGWLSAIKWARTRGCHWDRWTGAHAARHGHLNVLQWARCAGEPLGTWTCASAAEHGHINILEWASANGCALDEHICEFAARGGQLEALKWARANECAWSTRTCERAAQYGHLEVLQWARENECPWDIFTCMYAVQGGHFHVLRWACENKCPLDELLCMTAAKHGHLMILQWLRAHGCPWNDSTCYEAARSGHLEVLQWARENGCPHVLSEISRVLCARHGVRTCDQQ